MNLTGVRTCLALVLLAYVAPAQTPIKEAGCKTEKGTPTCNWYWFRKSLDAAHIVKAEDMDMDRSTGAQFKGPRERARKDRGEAGWDGRPDFYRDAGSLIGRGDWTGDEEILELRVDEGDSSRGKLIWVETYRGQRDKPWPANVHEAIVQFHNHLKT